MFVILFSNRTLETSMDSARLHEEIKRLPLSEFLSGEFIQAVYRTKSISADLHTRKKLGERMPTMGHNALMANFRQELEQAGAGREATVDDLLEKRPADLCRIPNFGKKSLDWIELYLSLFKLNLKNSTFNGVEAVLSSQAKSILKHLK